MTAVKAQMSLKWKGIRRIMHDPMTVAFEIRAFWERKRTLCSGDKRWYRSPFITIWHNDPDVGGDDDSCGWAFVRLTKEDLGWASARAKEEWKFWFSEEHDCIRDADDLAVLSLCWLEARHRATGTIRNKQLDPRDLPQMLYLLHSPGDNLHHAIEQAKQNEEKLENLLVLVLRIFKTRQRRWWQHPRWHIHHWSIQVKQIQTFNRWAFSRCCICGGRFKWGESPCAGWGGGGGPSFLRGEKKVWHMGCNHTTMAPSWEGEVDALL